MKLSSCQKVCYEKKTSAPVFKAILVSSPALKSVEEYASSVGKSENFGEIKNLLKTFAKNFVINVSHKFLKKDNMVKTVFKWNGGQSAATFVSTKTQNPSEYTYLLLEELSKKDSAIHKKIFGTL